MSNAFNTEISYHTLFSPEFNNLTEAYSTFGAGAYFVALMNIATDANKIGAATSGLSLKERRPDLWTVALTQENIDKADPFLKKVNELLLDYLGKLAAKIEWKDIADGTKSFIPHNPNLSQIQARLGVCGLALRDIAASFSQNQYDSLNWALAELNLSGSDLNVLKAGETGSATAWYNSITNTDGKYLPLKFKIIAGLDDDALHRLIYNGISIADQNTALPKTYINADLAKDAVTYTGAEFTHLSAVRVKRMQILLTLSAKLKWDYSALNAVLLKLGFDTVPDETHIKNLARLSFLASKWKYEPADLVNKISEYVSAAGNSQETFRFLNTAALKLSAPVSAIKNALAGAITCNAVIEKLFPLQVKSEMLAKTQLKLEEYLAILSLANANFLDQDSYTTWYAATCSKLDETEKKFRAASGLDLQQTIFQQWLHELSVYTGAHEPELRGLLKGIFGVQESGTEAAYKNLNQFFRQIKVASPVSRFNFFNHLLPYAFLVHKLNLDEPSAVLTGENIITTSPATTPANKATTQITDITALNDSVATTLVQYAFTLAQVSKQDDRKKFNTNLQITPFSITGFPDLMDWPSNNITSLSNALTNSVVPATMADRISLLYQLTGCYGYAASAGINENDLLSYVQNNSGDTYSPATITTPANGSKEFSAYRNCRGAQLEQDRNRLVPVVLKSLYDKYPDIDSPDHLSDYFLCDVNTGGIMDIAPLREATDAVQTYLMRCKAVLEQADASKVKTITRKEWEWIPSFRIWQAEQMLQTYPENYLQATARSTSSDLFKSMLNDLQGNDLTEEKAETAMLNYLDEWADLSNAKLVDASACQTYSPYFEKDVETTFLVSRSTVKENTFFCNYRENDGTKQRWSEWKEIPVNINADTVSSVYAFSRLHLFWAEESSVKDTDPTLSNDSKYTLYTRTIKCTYKNLDGSWTEPITITSFPAQMDLAADSKLIVPKPTFVPDKKVGINLVKDSGSQEPMLQLFFDYYTGENLPGTCVLDAKGNADQKLIDYVNFCNQQFALLSLPGIKTNAPLSSGGNKIYFSDADAANQLCTIDKWGKNKVAVGTIKTDSRVIVSDTKLYYKTGNNINTTDLSGGNLITITTKSSNTSDKSTRNFCVGGNYVYFRDTQGLLTYSKTDQLSDQSPIYSLVENKKTNWYYYSVAQSSDFVALGDYIFYVDSQANLARIALGGASNCGAVIFAKYNLSGRLAVMDNLVLFVTGECLYSYNAYTGALVARYNGVLTSTDLAVAGRQVYFEDKNHRIIRLEIGADGNADDDRVIFIATPPNNDSKKYIAASGSQVFFCDSGNNLCTTPYQALYNPVLLDKDLTLQQRQHPCQVLNVTNPVNNVKPVFYEQSGKFNVGCNHYTDFILENYRGTHGKIYYTSYADDSKLFSKNIEGHADAIFAVRNRPGAFVFVFRKVSYLFSIPMPQEVLSTLELKADGSVQCTLDASKITGTKYNVERIVSTVPSELRIRAHKNGMKFMGSDNQDSEFGIHKTKFSDLGPSATWVTNPSTDSDNKIDFTGAYGLCAREFFFHNPEAVAELLEKNFAFEDAVKWQQFVYSPTGIKNGETDWKKAVWKYQPFRSLTTDGTPPANAIDPDIIAENKLSVYEKWTVLQRINTILDFGDNEFRKETWESLSLATQLYFEAEDLLGQEPQVTDRQTSFESETNRNYGYWKDTSKDTTIAKNFGTPTNAQLKALWDRVADRLYKLRNGLNINGERQMPSEYGTPLDPKLLLNASENGGINPCNDSNLQTDRPVYRFRELAPHTESLINTVTDFGSKLYSALQQKDGEQLQVLQATHQVNMLSVVNDMYQYQIDEANKEVDSLKANLALAQQQANYYNTLQLNGLLAEETGNIASNSTAMALQTASAGVKGGAVAAHLIPTVFGFSDGAFSPGGSVEAAAGVMTEQGMAMQTLAQIFSAQAEYIRRNEEWNFQEEQAQQSIVQLQQSMEAAMIRVKIARENMRQYQLQVQQANEVLKYLNSKFTNMELYSWICAQLSSLYFTAYQLALGSLHKLQNAYCYELDIANANFIPSGSWDSLRKGLLSGETLKLALARMQDAYMNNNRRRQEVEKIISLKQLLGEGGIKNWDNVEFSLKGLGSNLKIKSIAVSIPAVIGPYETFDATLENKTANESITISKGIDDMGIFQEDMNDGRYLPFEGTKIGTGVDWKFTCSKQAMASRISDVILTVKAWIIPANN